MIEITSYSEISKWDTCHRQYYYAFGLGLRPMHINEYMDTGTKGHKLLQTFYECLKNGMNKEEAIIHVTNHAKKIIDESSMLEQGNLIKAWIQVNNYITTHDFKSDAILVENRFLIPVSMLTSEPFFDDVQIGFTPDVVFQRQGGFCDVEDAKFVGRAWSQAKIDRFIQTKLYQILLRKLGYNVSRTIVRFFNTTTNKITEKNYILSPGEEKTIIEEFLEGIREVIEYRRKPAHVQAMARRTSNHNTCQGCSFVFPCTLEASGKDATNTLKTMYQKSDYAYLN
jgi:PD-(D/E)XK nuclease superfamily